MAYAIRRKQSVLSRLFYGAEYLAGFTFQDGYDYRCNPCGYFAFHIINSNPEKLRKLAKEYDGEIVIAPLLSNSATYDLDDPNCYMGN